MTNGIMFLSFCALKLSVAVLKDIIGMFNISFWLSA